jgi:hypothetical protein
MKRRSVVLLVTLILLSASTTASGFWQRFTGDDEVIARDEPLSWWMSTREDKVIQVTYSVDVVSGNSINVLVLTEEDYDLYEDGLDYEVIESESKHDIMHADEVFLLKGSDTLRYFFVIEAANGTKGYSIVDYVFEYDYVSDPTRVWLPTLVIALGITVGAALFILWEKRRKAILATPPTETVIEWDN